MESSVPDVDDSKRSYKGQLKILNFSPDNYLRSKLVENNKKM